jgi:type I restriction enzyme R subunit
VAIHNENPFEREICEHLAANGWLYSPNDEGYDRKRALYPADVFAWLDETQPETLAKAVKPETADRDREALLDRLVKSLDAPFEASGGQQGGTLALLRRGFESVPNKFQLAQFKPADDLNSTTNAAYAAMRLRVMRQVHYSLTSQKSIDLVLFVNGLPVATIELKTDFTQSVQHAIEQYKSDRNPKSEPLLGFGRRALVHFAVSNREVHMSTKLEGASTRFLPFNQGNDGRAGNPLNPSGSSTAYLWQRVLQRDAWLNIIGRFMHLQVSKVIDPVTGEVVKNETLLFPRYHQWESVTQLIEAARTEGPGHKYLVQHSAGSGKTNSIAWTAHQLSTLHRPDGSKAFDSVIVVTDRTVLDTQLQDAIKQIDAKSGVVVGIDGAASGSKSEKLAAALQAKAPIIVVTIQTFGFVAEKLGALPDMSFAIIADEAHSSQTGTTANKVKQVLSPEDAADLDDGGEVSIESLLALQMEARVNATNISYFAYTATPKAKTLELFGRKNADGLPAPFHLYTMQQAIEERFILDVLQNYTPYKVAFKLAHEGQEYDADAPLVDRSAAVKQLMNWVKLHEFNISQKVRIIVEHYRSNVAWRLGGKAKAMVVTGSRKEAVRYKLAFDAYVAEMGYPDVRALVAFSGEVDDPESGPERFTETTMNPRLKGRSLAKAFETDEFQVMLVANKFQTGFDQPLLVGMYVDKKLSGVTAVQTLSRLNRTATGKDFTCVLDFVNDPEVIRESFEPYFRDARLSNVSDPNFVVDLRGKLEAYGIWEWHEVEAATRAQLESTKTGMGNNAYFSAIEPGRSRFVTRLTDALASHDLAEAEKLYLFRSDLTSFVNAYDFLSQVINFENTDLEKLSIYARGLARLIREENLRVPIDLSGVELVSYSIKKLPDADLGLDGGAEIDPPATGTKPPRDPDLVRLEEAVDQLNQLFDSPDLTAADLVGFTTHVKGKVAENELIQVQRVVNTEKQFLASTDLSAAVKDAMVAARDNNGAMTDELFGDEQKLLQFVSIIGKLLYRSGEAA